MKEPDQKLPTISLCMIVKDEEQNLALALDSVRDYVDEILITDTGSTDNTVEIAKKYTDKISYFEWCDDFAAARNYSIKDAKMDWILVWDADEIADQQSIRRVKYYLDELPEGIDIVSWKNYNIDKEMIAIFLQQEHEIDRNSYTHHHDRLFKNKKGCVYKNNLHEGIFCPGKRIKSDLMKYHVGSNLKKKDKLIRNINCAEKEYQLKPNEFSSRLSLIRAYGGYEDYEKIIIKSREFFNDLKNQESAKILYSHLLSIMGGKSQYSDFIVEVFERWRGLSEQEIEMYYYLGRHYFLTKEYKKARSQLEIFINKSKEPSEIRIYGPEHFLGILRKGLLMLEGIAINDDDKVMAKKYLDLIHKLNR